MLYDFEIPARKTKLWTGNNHVSLHPIRNVTLTFKPIDTVLACGTLPCHDNHLRQTILKQKDHEAWKRSLE